MQPSEEKVEVIDSSNPCCEHLKDIDRLNAKMVGLLTLAVVGILYGYINNMP
jgi:hypothetical protein